jgi:hypothetical protein
MTTQEMIDAFYLEYDLNGSAAVAGFEDSEVISFLNKSQLNLVKEFFFKAGPESLQVLVDHSSTNNLTVTGATYYNSNAYISTLPTDYLFYINSRTFLTRSSLPVISSNSWIDNREIKKEETSKFIEGDANATIFYNPVIFANSGSLTVIIDSLTTIPPIAGAVVSNFVLSYIKEPRDITSIVSSELDDKWHQNIVDAAVLNAMQVTNDFRIRQYKNNENDK